MTVQVLNTGAEIPSIGFGTWKSTEEEAYNAVIYALKSGYKHIDTACVYGNESIIGKAIKDSNIPRKDIFVTTKLWATGAMDPKKALEESLEKLGLEYVDLYFMHWPVAMNPKGNDSLFPSKPDGQRDVIDASKWSFIDTYKAMEKLVQTKMTRAIGVSNFTKNKMVQLLAETTIVPAALQIELHPLLPQQELVDFCLCNGIVVEAYSPLGSSGAPILKEKVILDIADKYHVGPATICISWAVWRKVVPLPKSIQQERIESNLKVVPLSDEDGKKISELYKTLGVHRFVSPNWGVKIFD